MSWFEVVEILNVELAASNVERVWMATIELRTSNPDQ
jgi:hypothetical protein